MASGAIQPRFPFLGIALLLTALSLGGCGGLPADFESLSLEEKVAAYEKHLETGFPLGRARGHIAWHGWAAADIMAECLTGERSDLPAPEAIAIIQRVQWRGCSLQGTAAERALEIYLDTAPPDSVDRVGAKVALSSIKDNYSIAAYTNALPGGPCQPEIEAKEEEK